MLIHSQYFLARSEESDDYAENESSPRKRSLKRPAALRDYVTEDKESTTTRYIENDEEDENEDYLVGKVQKAYQNLKRIQTVGLSKQIMSILTYVFQLIILPEESLLTCKEM